MIGRNREDQDRIDALTTRYAVGEISEPVYTASLRKYLNTEDIRFLVFLNQLAHRNSTAYKKGLVA
jgi:hypothetical protein